MNLMYLLCEAKSGGAGVDPPDDLTDAVTKKSTSPSVSASNATTLGKLPTT